MVSDTISTEISKRAGWSIFMGILTAAVGVVMITYPLASAAASTVFIGSALIIAAVAQLVFAFSSQTAGTILSQTPARHPLYLIAGVSLVAVPGIGVVTLTAMLGAMLIAEAVMEGHRVFAACGSRPRWVPAQRSVQSVARRDDTLAVAEQLDLGDRDARRCGRPLQRSHACGDLGQDPP